MPVKHRFKHRKSRKKQTLAQMCERLLRQKVVDQEYPGGKRRDSRLMVLESGKRVIATRRKDPSRIMKECTILKALNKRDVNVPRLIADNRWNLLIQEEIKGERLSRVLQDSDKAACGTVISNTLDSISKIQQTGSEHGLDKTFPVLGESKSWIIGFVQHPARIGDFFGNRPPRPDLDLIARTITPRNPRFVKWDSRPGNAMVKKGEVYWFDWEHAASRNRLDDVAWILGDEFTPDIPELESLLLEKHLPDFADDLSVDEAHHYLMVYGVLHMTVRLGLVLKNKKDKPWWDLDYCIKGDKVGVTKDCALRLCQRASRWSSNTPTMSALSDWYLDIAEVIEKSD